MAEELTTSRVYLVESRLRDGEAYDLWRFACPACGEELEFTSDEECRCRCGHAWTIEVRAVGRKAGGE